MTSRIFSTLFLSLILFVSVQAQMKIQSGSWSVNQSVPGFALDKNNGERTLTIEVRFITPFVKKPRVFLSIVQIDASNETNLRYNIEPSSISRDGFTIKVTTWSDSKIFSMSGYWFGYSE